MSRDDNPNWFANSPLSRANTEKDLNAAITARIDDPQSVLIPLWRGDPLIADGKALFLSGAARRELPTDAPIAYLGQKEDRHHFAIDLSAAAKEREDAPFAELGEYAPLRMATGILPKDDLAMIGHGRWLFEWRRKHRFCANCGGKTDEQNLGAKRVCAACGAEHFPRTDPVAIVLALHEDACLLARGAHFPPGFLSALAGFVEAAETPEEAAKREIFEETGVRLCDIRYQFSQPWPFPSSLMMGFFARAQDRALNLDTDEIEEARWIEKNDIKAMLGGEDRGGVFLPPPFTIARQLIERWASQ